MNEQPRQLIRERHAARELAANIVYQQLVRDRTNEVYSRRLTEYCERAEASPAWFCGLLGRECFDLFAGLKGLHKALLYDYLKPGRSFADLAEELRRRFQKPRYSRVCPVHRRLSAALLKDAYEECRSAEWTDELFENAREMLMDPEGPEEEYFLPAYRALEHAEDREASEGRIFEYARFLAEGAGSIRVDMEKYVYVFSDKYAPYRIQPCVKAYILVAAYEALEAEDVDLAVAVNEALNFIKIYAGEESAGFVNALLQDYYDSKKEH